ncbi:unnamed protein product, partial [Amoebophrya sp. A25]|eukprot:GSA25T00012333001.1
MTQTDEPGTTSRTNLLQFQTRTPTAMLLSSDETPEPTKLSQLTTPLLCTPEDQPVLSSSSHLLRREQQRRASASSGRHVATSTTIDDPETTAGTSSSSKF